VKVVVVVIVVFVVVFVVAVVNLFDDNEWRRADSRDSRRRCLCSRWRRG